MAKISMFRRKKVTASTRFVRGSKGSRISLVIPGIKRRRPKAQKTSVIPTPQSEFSGG